jgi:MFS family permease
MFGQYRQRAVVGFGLFIGQAYLYNAIFFTYALVLTTFYDVKESTVPIYIIPFAIGNLMGPLLLGRLFDTIGRKPMIAGSYIISGLGLLVTAYLFKQGVLTATTQTIAWCIIFFFASAGASAAYLTVSEIFPMETRAMAIAFFFAIGTAIGGIAGPLLFGKLIETERETPVFWGYVLGASLMIVGGVIQALWGVKAERRSLEDVALPVSAEDAVEERDDAEGGTAGAPSRDGDGDGRFTRSPRPVDSPQAATAVLAGAQRPVGPSATQAMYSPQQVVGERSATDVDVDREVDALVDVLSTRGELTRRELGALAETKAWGPGRFGRALELGVLSGRIRRTGRDRYAAGGDDGA